VKGLIYFSVIIAFNLFQKYNKTSFLQRLKIFKQSNETVNQFKIP